MKLLALLASTNSKSEKINLINHHQLLVDDRTASVFEYALNPYKTYNMKWADVNLDLLGEPTARMFDLLDSILEGKITGNVAKTYVDLHTSTDGDLIKLIINKNLRCGTGASIVNKCYHGLIPVFQIQKAKAVPIDDLKYPQICQLKYDGVRLLARVEDGVVTFRSSGGRLANFPELNKAVVGSSMKSGILDGELVWDKGTQADRTIISGKLNSAMKGGTVDELKMKFQVFDQMSLAAFDTQSNPSKYETRFNTLKGMLKLSKPNDMIQLAETFKVFSAEEAGIVYGNFISYGFEGIILKAPDSKYTFKRSKDWVKVKETKTADLICVGFEEGRGKFEGFIGALMLEGIVEDTLVKVKVGSGLTDIERTFPLHRYLNECVEVKYNSVIQDSVTKDYSLFLPRFVTVRIDK